MLHGKSDHVSGAEVSASMMLASAKAAIRGGYCVVLEGILNCNQDGRGKYRSLLEGLVALADEMIDVTLKLVYLNVPIEVTKQRHLGREKAQKFGTEKLDKWWSSSKPSGIAGEVCIDTGSQSIEDTVALVLEHMAKGEDNA
jgi:hypothetical protein